ncbi:MAG TPA: threonine/serine dehydratase [Acidimicrobiales bacterium]|nr:threonine/serine dehydratase [Acidimicrobiales bacterium]
MPTFVLMVTRAEIAAAAENVRPWVRRTPILRLEADELGIPHPPLTLKLEQLQHAGSFKARGAHNLLLTVDVPSAGVVAASGGNFGLAIAHAAGRLNHHAAIFLPEVSSAAKVARLRSFGAEVVIGGAFYAEAYEASVERATSTGALLAHAYDQAEVVAGAGTCAVELEEQAPDFTTVVVAVGGGGLIGGIAGWLQDEKRVIAVESTGTPTLRSALDAGNPVDVDLSGIAADSLGARRIGSIGFEAARRWVDDAVLVADDAIIDAQRRLWDHARVAAEPGGATALAAVLSGVYQPEADERLAVIICGANLDPSTL